MKKKKNELTFLNYLIKDGERLSKWWKNTGKEKLVKNVIDPAIFYGVVSIICLWVILGVSLLASSISMPCAIEFGGYDKNNLWIFVFLILWVVITYLFIRYLAYREEVEKQQQALDKHNETYS